MKDHLRRSNELFAAGCNRASNLTAIHAYLKRTAPLALNCDDILRSALVLAVSSFDLFVHDVFRLEVLYRLSVKREVPTVRVPLNTLHLEHSLRFSAVDECIKNENSYKSFVAPHKLAECLQPLIESPWENISSKLGRSASDCKTSLKRIVDLRNRIAHEADVNPSYGGIELWPIYEEDVDSSIEFLRKLGAAVAVSINE